MSFSNIMDSNAYTADGDADPLIVARERVLGPANRLFYDRPVHLVRGQGSHLFDADGVRYLDAYNNVASVGHCHPHVVDAVMQQMSTLNTHTRYLHRGIVDYSERLLATMPKEIDQVMYACTGSEVNDLALRVAEMYTDATGVIVTSDAYHGNTAAVMAISPSLGDATTLPPWVRTVPPPDSAIRRRCGPRGRRPRREGVPGELPHRRHHLLVRRHLPGSRGPRARGRHRAPARRRVHRRRGATRFCTHRRLHVGF
jgi:4-aminobutyrate aminotransferase-like enzyme